MTDRVSKIILRGDISDLQAKLVAAGRSLKDVADQTTNATRESRKFRDGMSSAGDAAGKMALVTGAAFVGIAASAANFEQGMSAVQAATHETTQNMELLRDAAIEAGQRTVFSATEAAAAVENLAKAGVSTQDILGGGLNGALDLAAAGSLEVADAAEIAATAMTQFGLSGTEVPHVADLLAAAAGKAQGEVSDMSFALKQSGLIANQMGLSIEETTGALASFASAGLLGSDAGTSFKTMLGALTPNSKKASEEMKRLNISAFDAQGNFIGLAKFSGVLHEALKGLTDQQRQSALETIFGSDAVRAASVLYEQGAEGIQEWISKVNDQGFAAETAAIKLDNLKGDIEKLTGSLETLFITSGEGSQGFLRGATQSATDFVDALASLPAPIKTTTTALLGITAITGGSLWFGSKVVRGVAQTRKALDDLGTTGVKAGRALKGLTIASGVISGLYALDAVMKSIGENGAAAETVQELTSALLSDQPRELAEKFGGLGESLDLIGSKGSNAVAELESMIPVLPEVAEGISGLLGFDDTSLEDKVKAARTEIETLDQALSGLVSSSSAGQARTFFKSVADAAGLTAVEQKRLMDQLPGFRDALAGVANESKLAANGERILGDAAGDTADSMDDQAEAIEKAVDAMRAKRDMALAAENAEIGYQQALDDAAKALKENGRTLDITTQKGRDNKQALLEVAASWNELSDQEKNQRGARKQAIDTFADMAVKMGMSEKAARRLAQQLLEIPPKVVTRATLDTAQAEAALRRFVTLANGTRITIHADGSFTTASGQKGYADGGYTGSGGKYQPAGVVHAGEYVFSAEATRGNVGYLETLHNALRGYANGGEVHAARSYTTNNYYGGNAPAVRAAPVFENVTVKANDMREFVAFGRNTQRLVDGGGVAF